MILAVIVLLMGHDEWSVREWATKLCNDPIFEPYLRHALLHSECPEIRNRAYSIYRSILYKREIAKLRDNPEEWYRNWIANGARPCIISDYEIILDASTHPGRKALIESMCPGITLGSWAYPGPILQCDYISLNKFRKELSSP